MTGGGHVAADLVGSTRKGPRFKQRSLSTGLHYPKAGLGLFAVLVIQLHLSPLLGVGAKFEAAGPLRWFWDAMDDGQINFLHLPALEPVAVGLNSSRTLGQQQNSGGVG